MAFHPFRTFQRHQKGCMVGAVLLAMISFLFLGVIIQLFDGRSGSGSQTETIAECRRFGKITNYELYRLQENQETLKRFLIVLYQKLADPADEEKMRALYSLQMLISQVAQLQNPEQLINAWLITRYTQEEGLSPDWNDILTMLREATGGYLSDTVYDDTVRSVGITQQTIEALLARHIVWQQALERFQSSVSAVSPAMRWDWYQRLYRQVTIEAAAVSIDLFMDQVGEPSTGQLNTLFEKYKTKKYNPSSPDSGFVMPTEIAFQYIVAEPNPQMLDSITEEEMLAYYEENKDTLFRKPVTPITDYPQLPGMMPGGGAFPFPTPGRPVMPTAPMPTEEMPQTEEPTPAEEETPNSEESKETEESVPETSATSKVLMRLVSYQMDEEEQAESVTDPAPQQEEQKPLSMSTPSIIIQEEEENFTMPTTTTPPSEEPKESEPAKEDEPIDLSYRPFDEVKDQIRETLAREKATAGLPIILEKMKEYAAIYNEHLEQGKQIPPMPDLTDVVAAQGLELKTVPLGDIYAAMRTELARGFQERQHLARIFRRTPLLFEGETFSGSNSLVLYWVTEQKDEKRPEKLDEVKEIVLKRWKEIESRALVLKKAEELANEAKTSGKPLAELFAGRNEIPVVETEPFSWKTYGGLHPITAVMRRIPPVLGEVREKGIISGNSEMDNQIIVAPGSDFMETVYSLQVGETGMVFNQPQSAAYIVRVTSSSPSEDVLWEQFQRSFVLEYLYAGQPEMMASAFEAWLNEIQEKTGFRWVNKPDARNRITIT